MTGIAGFINQNGINTKTAILTKMAQSLQNNQDEKVFLHYHDYVNFAKVSLGLINPEPQPFWDKNHLVALIIFVVLLTLHKHQEKLKTDKRYARRLRAPLKARKGILEAQRLLRQEKRAEFVDVVHKTLTGYLADKFHLPAGGVTIDTVKAILVAKDIDGEILDRLTNIFNACDMARYAPLEFDASKRETVFDDMRKIIDCLERRKV